MRIQIFYIKNTGLNLKYDYLLRFSQINAIENRKAIEYGQSRDTSNVRHKSQNKDKQSTMQKMRTIYQSKLG